MPKPPPALFSKAQRKPFDVSNYGTAMNHKGRFENQTPFAHVEIHQGSHSFPDQSFPKPNLRLIRLAIILIYARSGRQLTRLLPAPSLLQT